MNCPTLVFAPKIFPTGLIGPLSIGRPLRPPVANAVCTKHPSKAINIKLCTELAEFLEE